MAKYKVYAEEWYPVWQICQSCYEEEIELTDKEYIFICESEVKFEEAQQIIRGKMKYYERDNSK